MTLPKPVKRAPRPSKRIARTSRPAKVRKTPRGKLGRLADKLFSKIVRHRGVCVEPDRAHVGGLQCAHIVSRSYRSTRWDESNALPLCAGCHSFYTPRPLEWELFVRGWIGWEAYDTLKMRALLRWDGDLDGTVARLKARAEALGIKA